jgi:hypothetical protein
VLGDSVAGKGEKMNPLLIAVLLWVFVIGGVVGAIMAMLPTGMPSQPVFWAAELTALVLTTMVVFRARQT